MLYIIYYNDFVYNEINEHFYFGVYVNGFFN